MKNEYTLSEDGTYAIVKLTQGQVTLVDVEDLEKIGEYRWYAAWNPRKHSYYAVSHGKSQTGKRTHVSLSRFLLNAPKGMVVDHVNTDSLNNSRSNLRLCSYSQNGANRGKNRCNSSGHKGIIKKGNSYILHIAKNGKKIYLGSYKDIDEAINEYEKAAKEINGSFYRIQDSAVMEKRPQTKQYRTPIKHTIEGYGEVYKVPLNNGEFSICDIDDYEIVSNHLWHAVWNKYTKSYYASTNIRNSDGKRQTMHMQRAIMNAPKGMFVDHINHDTLDNRRCNLRLATKSENMMNRRRVKPNSSGLKGVYKKSKNKWYAIVTVRGNRINLGIFETKDEAYAAYCEAALKYHGEFACL